MSELAIFGGPREVNSKFNKYRWFNRDSIRLTKKIIKSGNLSDFLAQPNEKQFGGEHVLNLEKTSKEEFGLPYAVSFNSWTSGLEACIRSLDLEKGSEVIVPAWTMSASISCILLNDLIPVIVDIDKNTYNLDPKIIENFITSKTQAILAVDIFGYPCDAVTIQKIAAKHNLAFVVDSAQSPLAAINGIRSINYADVGGYSLNRHKHIQVGEGGIAVTNSEEIARNLRLIRNHGEVTADSKNHPIIIGHNWRLGEIEAGLANIQLKDLEYHVKNRRNYANTLKATIEKLPGIKMTEKDSGVTHDYYILGMQIDTVGLDIERQKIADALMAEGVPGLLCGYSNLHKNPAFAKYVKENLEVMDYLNRISFLGIYLCGYDFSDKNLRQISNAFQKVWANLSQLRQI
jgi:dTDP-4-amino-4,6-dideoxygalactose transaminase